MSEHRILLKGRLGNQMFIYALACSLKSHGFDIPVLIDDWLLKHNVSNRLDCFTLSDKVKFGHGSSLNILQKSILFIAIKILHNTKRTKRHNLEEKLAPLLSRFGIYYITDGYYPLPSVARLKKRNYYFEGYFQSERYFLKHKKQILNDFTFNKRIVDSCQSMASEIQNAEEPTCLHVRLGDYVKHYLHGVANAEYYKKALLQLRERKPQAKVFLFSDNIAMARKELDLDDDVVCLPDDCDEQQTMYLGSLCKNFIISNSSFSWWMQYLSVHSDKLVFAPSRWYAADVPCDLYLDDWNLIEV